MWNINTVIHYTMVDCVLKKVKINLIEPIEKQSNAYIAKADLELCDDFE